MANWKKNMIHAFMITMWCTIGLATVVLSVAAMKNKNHQLCTGYEIEISGGEEELFIDKKKVEEILFHNPMDAHRRIAEYDLWSMERKLEANVWIRDAQLFFDKSGKLQVIVQEREPIARVFTTEGKTFFIDSRGVRLPVEEIVRQIELHCPIRMVVVDGAQDFGHTPSRHDSEWRDLYIAGCHKWLRAYQPLGVMFAGRRLSRESIESALAERMGRGEIDDPLLRFTQQIERHCPDGHTETVVVATRKADPVTKQDSLLAVQKVQQMIAAARQLEPDTLSQVNIQPVERSEMNEQSLKNYDLLPMNTDSALPETPKTPDPVKTIFEKQTNQHISKPIKKVTVKKEPKATMEKRGF